MNQARRQQPEGGIQAEKPVSASQAVQQPALSPESLDLAALRAGMSETWAIITVIEQAVASLPKADAGVSLRSNPAQTQLPIPPPPPPPSARHTNVSQAQTHRDKREESTRLTIPPPLKLKAPPPAVTQSAASPYASDVAFASATSSIVGQPEAPAQPQPGLRLRPSFKQAESSPPKASLEALDDRWEKIKRKAREDGALPPRPEALKDRGEAVVGIDLGATNSCTPLTLSIETMGGISTPMIPHNTAIPTKKIEIFSTVSDNQPAVDIVVLLGERKLSRDNTRLAIFKLDGIPPAPRGVPQVEVTFDIDANGILKVHARDLMTGKEQKVTITTSSRLSKGDVEKMVKEAELHTKEDRKEHERIELRNQSDNVIYQARKTLKEAGDKISDEEKRKTKSAMADLEKADKDDNVDAMRRGQEVLAEALHGIASNLYEGAKGRK